MAVIPNTFSYHTGPTTAKVVHDPGLRYGVAPAFDARTPV